MTYQFGAKMARSTRRVFLGTLLALILATCSASRAANFTTGTDPAVKFGVHEIVLTGDGSVANPLDTVATITFTPPSGAKQAKTVYAFHDGGNTWRARVYVSEVGKWNWSSTCKTDKGLDGKSGTFQAEDSKLRGRLLPHPKNPRQWMTEDGRWFLNLVDTAYRLLGPMDSTGQSIPEEDFHAYVRDAVNNGITSFMTSLINRHGAVAEQGSWAGAYFADVGFTRLRLENFRFPDRRLRWLLNHYPDVGLELILFPRGVRYARDEQFWKKLTAEQKERILRYMVARYAAYPQVFWLVANDAHYGKGFPNNNAYVREVGAYFQKHDPWHHPMSTGHARHRDFVFGDEDWATYLHLENAYDLGASQYAKYHRLAKPVLMGEERYEQDYPGKLDPLHMRYYQRRLYWAWLLSGGSANYGGRFWVLHPYSQTGKREARDPRSANKTAPPLPALTGLDSVRFIRDYFADRKIELSDFVPDHSLARDPDTGPDVRAPKLMRRGYEEFLLYLPNAAADGREARVDAERTARVRIDLRKADGLFAVEWYRAHDGIAQEGEQVAGGKEVELVAPWPGYDVVLRLSKPGNPADKTGKSDLPRLPRDNLLVYRGPNGKPVPVKSVEDWAKRRAEVVRGMETMMGRLPGEAKRCPLDVKVEEEVDCDTYIRRRITYVSEPGCRVPAYLLIPKDVLAGKKKAPAVLCLHGTDDVIGPGTVVGLGKRPNRNYAQELAQRGYVALAPNYSGLARYKPDWNKLGWQSNTLKVVWDNMRGLDLLASLPYVDSSKGFGTIGHSLGGHNSVFTAVFDDRLTAVVSSCGLDSFLDYFKGDPERWGPGKGWCQKYYMPKLVKYKGRLEDIPFDFHEMVGALAPRHVLIIAPKNDSNFRADSVDRIAAAARPVFKLYGHENRLCVEHPDCPHDFPPEMREVAYKLFDDVLREK